MQDGEALASADTPPQSFYELTAKANLPLLTAIRIDVPPLDPEKARHTPENGFIVDKVQGWVLRRAGERAKLRFAILSRIRRGISGLRYPKRTIRSKKQNRRIPAPAHLRLYLNSSAPAGS